MELSIEEKISKVSQMLLASPAGEINDVFNDIRTIIQDDAALEARIGPAFEQYNIEQYTVAELPGVNEGVLICRASQLPGQPKRFIDPRSKQTFEFDHVQLRASELQPLPVHEELEPIRAALESSVTAYATNYYSQGVGSAYTLAPPPSSSTSTTKPESPVETTSEPIEEDSSAEATEPAPVEPTPTASAEPLAKKFALYLVGNRYNPSNFWTGRWRSHYEIDLDAGTVKGEMMVNVHYYEQGNVQMHASLPVEFEVNGTGEPAAIAKEVLKKIGTAEHDYQMSVNEAYYEMSEKTFKELRRALPVHKQKLDWNRISSYKLGSDLKKA